MNESKLLFIVSQPRSGSTLTQKLLSNNAHVDTVSEPWLLLPLLSIFKPDIIEAQYNYPVALNAFFDFLKKRDAEEDFRMGLKKVVLDLYKVNGESLYFIDKTPRYYEILPEIFSFFPEAKFLILKRSPFAALHSMLATWSDGKVSYKLLQTFYRDFLVAPFLIQQFLDRYGANSNVRQVQYEALVNNPSVEVKTIYDWLDIPYSRGVLNIGGNDKVKGIYGDDVYKSKPLVEVSAEKTDSWRRAVKEDQDLSVFFGEYQEYLTAKFINKYGYDSVNFKRRKWKIGASDFERIAGRVNIANELK